ncbi:protein kinase [bacterium]|nr:protein kinase [bacterium]
MSLENNALDIEDEDFVDELKPGTKLMHGQYTIEDFLAAGGFGITYLARDSLNRQLVIKECFPGNLCRRQNSSVTPRSRSHQDQLKSVVRLFLQEAMSLAKANHPNIVGVHQVFEENNTAYMALDFIQGRDLLEILQEDRDSLTPPLVEGYLAKMLDAIEHIHQLGILHRDISPDNILVNQQGEPILIDFGAARESAIDDSSRALSALRVVKEGYSPQEFYIVGSDQAPSSDLYSLAASFYHIITGDLPPDSQVRLSSFAAGDDDPYVPLGQRTDAYSKNFVASLDKALEILPRDRMQSAGEWLAHMTGAAPVGARKTSLRNISSTEKTVAPKRVVSGKAEKKTFAPILMGTTALVAIVGVGFFFATSSGSEDVPAEVVSNPFAVTSDAPAPVVTTPPVELAPAAPTVVVEAPAISPDVAALVPQVATDEPVTPEITGPALQSPEPQVPAAEETANLELPPIVLALPETAVAPQPRPLREPAVVVPELDDTPPTVGTIAPVAMTAPVLEGETVQPQVNLTGNTDTSAVVVSIPKTELTLNSALPDTTPSVLPNALPPAPQPPAPEVLELEPSAVVARFVPKLPFTLSNTQPGQITSIADVVPAWLTEQAQIVSIDGQRVTTNGQIIAQLDALAAQTNSETFDVSIGITSGLSGAATERRLTIAKENSIELQNGLKFVANEEGGVWTTEVVAAPDTSNFMVGDIIVSFVSTWENLDGPNSLKTILDRELADDKSTVSFAVRRNGQIWMEDFNLAALAN